MGKVQDELKRKALRDRKLTEGSIAHEWLGETVEMVKMEVLGLSIQLPSPST